MKKLWIKFSDERNKRCSIKTTILMDEKDGKRYVTKEAIFPEGRDHLQSILNYASVLGNVYTNIRMCPVILKDYALWFDYVVGESLEEQYRRCVREKDEEALEKLLTYHTSLICGPDENSCVFQKSSEFERIFGNGEIFDNTPGLKISNFDAIASNIIFDGDIPTFIDYEWVFLEPLPRDLVIFHCIHNLYLHILHLEEFYPLHRALEFLHITIGQEVLQQACSSFFHSVISEEDGKSFASAKQVCLKEERDVQYYIEESKNAHEQWEICANNWKSAVKSYDELQATCNEIERYWKQSTQANAQLNAKLLAAEAALTQKTQEEQIHQQEIQQWKTAYETVINSRTWRIAGKIKKIFGRG